MLLINLVSPTPGISSPRYLESPVSRTPDISSPRYLEPLIFQAPGISNPWYFKPPVSRTPDISNPRYLEHLIFQAPGISNPWYFKPPVSRTPGISSSPRYLEHLITRVPGISSPRYLEPINFAGPLNGRDNLGRNSTILKWAKLNIPASDTLNKCPESLCVITASMGVKRSPLLNTTCWSKAAESNYKQRMSSVAGSGCAVIFTTAFASERGKTVFFAL